MTTAHHLTTGHAAGGPPLDPAAGDGATVLPDGPPVDLARSLPPGNACVLGAPGSGKSALLEAVLLAIHATPGGGHGVLLAANRQAAAASTERLLDGMRGSAAAGLGATTWQQFARTLVAPHADLLGFRGEPRVLSGAEQWSLVRSLLAADGADAWAGLAPLIGTRGFADELAGFVLACERRLLGGRALASLALSEGIDAWRHAADFLDRYVERLAGDDAVDQAGLIVRAGDLLERRPDLRASIAAQVGTILVDDAQELDPSQRRLARLLIAGGTRAVLAGDPAGVIEAFRGAVPGALPRHATELGARIVLLPGSHRLGRPGLAAVRRLQRLDRAASHLAQFLPPLPAEPAATPPAGPAGPGHGATPPPAERPVDGPAGASGRAGGALEVVHAASRTEEAESVAGLLRLAHQRDGVPYERMAVLLTHRSQTGLVRHALERFGVPYRLGAGDSSPLEEPVVARTLDLFRLVLDPDLAEELLPGLLTSALGGLDPHDLRALRRAAVVADRPVGELVGDPDLLADLPARIRRRVAAFEALRRRAGAWVALDADRCFWELWRAAPAFRRLVRRVEADPGDADAGRQLDALTALSRALTAFVETSWRPPGPGGGTDADQGPDLSIRGWLDLADRAAPSFEAWPLPTTGQTTGVTVLSLGAARGLEVDVAVVTGCLEGVLPRTTWPDGLLATWRLDASPAPLERARAWLDTERRRFLLGITRARQRTILTWSQADGHGEPSRFLAELGLGATATAGPADLGAPDAAGVVDLTVDLTKGSVEDAAVPDAAGARHLPFTRDQLVGALRRILADTARPRAERLAAATTLAGLPEVDPASWWWARDWTVDPEPIAPEGHLRTSYTRISAYEDCPLRYFYASVAGLDDRATYRMTFGKLMHTIFELAGAGDIAGDPDSLKAAFRERFDPSSFPSRAVASQYWRDGMAMLRYWYEGEAALARDSLAIEVGFDIEVGDHVVRGRIDRVDRAADGEGIILLDYKTARSIPSEAETARSLQLAIYYLAALRDPELSKLGPPVEMQLVYPAEQRRGAFRRVAQRPDADHADRVERRLLPLLEGAAAERFQPDPHANCHFCSFKPICPLWPQGEEFLAPPPAGSAEPVEVAG